MVLLSITDVRAWDAYTIQHEPVSSFFLMERAAHRWCDHWRRTDPHWKGPVQVWCGTGNNGGDGLVIARRLSRMGVSVEVVIVGAKGKGSVDFQKNMDRLPAEIGVRYFSGDQKGWHSGTRVLVDALFGTGLNREPEGDHQKAIHAINQSGKPVIAVDVPSGMLADAAVQQWPETIVHASRTLTFQCPKPGFVHRDNAVFLGDWYVVDIGLHPGFTPTESVAPVWVDENWAREHAPPLRHRFSEKRDFGHLLIVGGSVGMAGAVGYCARAALKTGVGLCELTGPCKNREVLQSIVPQAMWSAMRHEDIIAGEVPLSDRHTAIALGPGMGRHPESARTLRSLMEKLDRPSVWDADALNMIGEFGLLEHLPEGAVLTPHDREFRRLFGTDDKYRNAQADFSGQYGVVIVRKGPYTYITHPDGRSWWVGNGSPALAKGGSGDVLTGIIGALLAMGMETGKAAAYGCRILGEASVRATGNVNKMEIDDLIRALDFHDNCEMEAGNDINCSANNVK